MEVINIYKLIDPLTSKIRYIGKTKNSLSVRLSGHLSYSGSNLKLRSWINSLKTKNLKPIIELIEVCKEYNWCIREQFWIDLLIKDIKDYDEFVKNGFWAERPCNYNSYGKNTECEYCQMAEVFKN